MKKLAAMLALALISTGLFACGGADSSTTNTTAASPTTSTLSTPSTAHTTKYPLQDDVIGDSHVRYVADPNGKPAYRITEASASPGKATIQFVNPQSVVHNVVIEGPNGETIGETKKISEGITSTEVVVKPGVYVVYCSVPGHRKAGMLGHLSVYPK